MTQNKKIYAVTGGIGCGKTAVSGIIRREGYPVFSCDEIYAGMTKGGELVKKLEEKFGGVTLPDGSLDRRALSSRIFADDDARRALDKITHPAIMKELFSRAADSDSKVVFCEVPLLFENGFEKLFDGVIVVTRPLAQRVKAVMERSGLSENEVLARIDAQFDYGKADLTDCYVVSNDGDMDELDKKVKKILQNIANLT